MTITITRVGTADVDSGGGGTNGVNTFVSASQAWAVGDYVLVGGYIEQNSVDNWTFSTTLTPSGGALGTAVRVTNADDLLAYNPGYEGRVVILAAEVTTGFTGTVTVTRTPTGSADHWTSCNFYRLEADGAISFPRNDTDYQNATSTTTGTTDLGSVPASTSALFAVVGGEQATFGVSLNPMTFPSGWTVHGENESGGWSGGSAGFATGFKVGSGTQVNNFVVANAISAGGSIFAAIVEIAEAGSSLITPQVWNGSAWVEVASNLKIGKWTGSAWA